MAKQDKAAGPMPEADGIAAPEGPPPADLATIEIWREVRAPEAWAHNAAKQLNNWPVGQMVSLSEYDAAIKAAHTIEVS